jgi:hypothetical protein
MRMVTNRRSVVGKDVYVGIDVRKESRQVTVRTDGEEIFNGSIRGQYQSLKKLLGAVNNTAPRFCSRNGGRF